MNIIETTNDPNLALTTLYNILNTVLSHHAPIKSKRVKRIHQPGLYSDELKQARFKGIHLRLATILISIKYGETNAIP